VEPRVELEWCKVGQRFLTSATTAQKKILCDKPRPCFTVGFVLKCSLYSFDPRDYSLHEPLRHTATVFHRRVRAKAFPCVENHLDLLSLSNPRERLRSLGCWHHVRL
jgi:hypothetical protein